MTHHFYPQREPGDWLSEEGAADLAHRIEKYHEANGLRVHCEVVPIKQRGHSLGEIYAVRSDLKLRAWRNMA